MSTKIHPSHLQRDAYIYVRQSTGHQCSHPRVSGGNMPSPIRPAGWGLPGHRDR